MTDPEGQKGEWPVQIGKAAALAMLSKNDFGATREDWKNWLNRDSNNGSIVVKVSRDSNFDTGVNDTEIEFENKVFFSAS